MVDTSSIQNFLPVNQSNNSGNIFESLNNSKIIRGKTHNYSFGQEKSQKDGQIATFRNPNDKSKDEIKRDSCVSKRKIGRSDVSKNNNSTVSPKKSISQIQTIKDTSSIQSFFLKHHDNQSKKSDSTRVFWGKDTVKSVWNKLLQIKNKVKEKKSEEYLFIKKAIENNEDSFILNHLRDEQFKKFYRSKDSLFPDNVFFDILIDNLKFKLLMELMQDPSYCFHDDFIIQFIIKTLQEYNKHSDSMSISEIDASSHQNSKSRNEDEINPLSSHFDKLFKTKSMTSLSKNSKKKEILENLIVFNLYPQQEEKVKIIGWYLASFGLYDIFKLLLKKSKCFDFEKSQFNNFEHVDDISLYGKNLDQFQNTLNFCLKCNYQDLAILLCDHNFAIEELGNLISYATETESMEFLKYLWEKGYHTNYNYSTHHNNSNNKNTEQRKPFSQKRDSSNEMQINTQGKTKFQGKNETRFKANFPINTVIKNLKQNQHNKDDQNKLTTNLNHILNWKNIEKDPTFIGSLFQFCCFDQISLLISRWPADRFSSPEYFKSVILNKETELILFYLKRRDCRQILSDHQIQECIVKNYTAYGDKLYYGAEMLVYIYKNQWKGDYTKELCKNIMKAIKTKDILNCHSSILTCLLLCEFLTQIKEISIINVSRCEKVMSELKEYCKIIQESNPQEGYISYLMKQKDTRERSAFHIASENSMYSLLETAEIGTIVKKMWDGTLSNNGFLVASSMHRFCVNYDKKPCDPFYAFDTLDLHKVYFFQLAVWLDSCSLRFNPVGISTIAIVVIYNLFIFFLNVDGQLLNSYWELSTTLRLLLNLYLVMVSSLIVDFFFKVLFIIKTNRAFKLEVWTYIDFILFILAWLITLDTKFLAKEYRDTNLHESFHAFIWNMGTSFTKELANEVEDYSTSVAFIVRVVILSLNDLLVWIRVCGILLTFKQMGPVIRMIISMAILLLRYIVIIALFLACCAAIFTAIFNKYSLQFFDFSTSIITLFGGFLNNFDVQGFEEQYRAFGSVLLMAYVCVSGVLLVNLLVAVLSNVYEELAKVVDASHRAVLIQYYRKYKWDNNFGYLMFLTPPLNIINIIVMVISLTTRIDKKKINDIATKIFYLLFYFPFIIVSFLVYTVFLIPISYTKGIIVMFDYLSQLKISKILKILHFIQWVFGGLFFLLYIYFRDIVYCIGTVFNKVEGKTSDFQRIKRNISNQDVIIFLKFIHSKISQEDRKDIHSLFMAYLDFEASQKALMNEDMKKRKDYYNKLNRVSGIVRKKSNKMDKKIFIYNNCEEGKNAAKGYTQYIRKNLMIIEILENFIIDDEFNSTSVDIEKMRKLLPRTMNIKNYHLRRLVNSDAHALNQAMAKLKISKNTFLQYQLVNKIMSSAQRLDKEIDSEILKIQRMKNSDHKLDIETKRAENSASKNYTNDEQTKQLETKKADLELMKGYEVLIRNIQQTVLDIIASKKEHQSLNQSQSIAGSLISHSFRQHETLLSKKKLSNSQVASEFKSSDKIAEKNK